jgi:hypothetical protein
MVRVRWRSRLGLARPQLFADVEFLRIRHATGLAQLTAQATAPKAKKMAKRAAAGNQIQNNQRHGRRKPCSNVERK